MKELIPRRLYDVAIQAASVGKLLPAQRSRRYVKRHCPCYGGDVSRRKLLEKQKAGKTMKQVGNVEVPQEAFLGVLKVES